MRIFGVILALIVPTLSQAQFAVVGQDDLSPDGFARIEIDKQDFGYVLTGAVWSSPVIPVCWENPEPETENLRRGVRAVIAETWAAYSRLDFTGWDKCAERNVRGIRILIDNQRPHVKVLGKKLSGEENGMVLNFTYNLDGFRACLVDDTMFDLCNRAIAVHEFGHAIGLSHEHNRDDRNGSCRAAAQGTDGDKHLTPYDPDSVMNYCNPTYGNFGKLSYYDVLSVQAIYGAPE